MHIEVWFPNTLPKCNVRVKTPISTSAFFTRLNWRQQLHKVAASQLLQQSHCFGWTAAGGGQVGNVDLASCRGMDTSAGDWHGAMKPWVLEGKPQLSCLRILPAAQGMKPPLRTVWSGNILDPRSKGDCGQWATGGYEGHFATPLKPKADLNFRSWHTLNTWRWSPPSRHIIIMTQGTPKTFWTSKQLHTSRSIPRSHKK